MPEPMVQIGMMRDRAVFWTNIVALIAGFAMFGTFLLVPTFVQMGAGLPAGLAAQVSYGFGASVIVAGLYLLPSSVVMLIVGPIGGMLEVRVGARVLTAVGCTVLGLGRLRARAGPQRRRRDRHRHVPGGRRRRAWSTRCWPS